MLLVFGLCEFLVPVLDKQKIVIIGCVTGPNNELHPIHPVPFKVCASRQVQMALKMEIPDA